MRQRPNPSRGRRLDDPMPPTAARQQSAIFYGISLQQRCVDCPFAMIKYIICADFVSSGASSRRTLQKYLLKESFFIQIFLRYVQLPTKISAGSLYQKSFSVLPFMRQRPNPSRGRRLDDPMPPTAARQQSAIFYGISLQQRCVDCPFAMIKYIICADFVSSGASSRRTMQKYLLKGSFFIQIFLRYVQLPTNKIPRGAVILFYLLFLRLYSLILKQIFQAFGRR